MGRSLLTLTAVLGLWVAFALALAWPGGLFVTKHSADAVHMVAIADRIAQGDLPHLDFMTPIGILAFWPISMVIRLGFDVGQAFLFAQIVFGAVMGLIAFFATRKRMDHGWVLIFVALVLILSMALVHGEADIAVSVSMHYNRWAWSVAFVALAMAMLSPEGPARFDGPLIGFLMVALALIKVTYFAALAPIVIVGLALTGQRRTLLTGILVGLFLVLVMTGIVGVNYWTSYLGDLLAVAGSEIRSQPGLDLIQMFTAPPYLAATFICFAMVVVLRRSGLEAEGLLVLMLIGAGGYITYQNFGNDPQWWALLALFLGLWSIEVPGQGARTGLMIGSIGLAAMSAPSFLNMTVSPFRHAAIPQEDYIPELQGGSRHQDLYVSETKANRLRADTPLGDPYRYFGTEEEVAEPVVFQGQVLNDCQTEPIVSYYGSITQDLRDRGLAQGAGIFSMDILNPYWLYGDHRPLEGGTPWYYSGLPGLDDAEFVLLPACPIRTKSRDLIVEAMGDIELREVVRTPMYTLYEKPQSADN
ncbi:MAG: hypothetical protein AAGI10_03945 [Pseudomonadota bacterium]